MFAAKEAVAKALGEGFSGFGASPTSRFSPILPGGRAPGCAAGRSRACRENASVHLSVSHDGGLALAFAVVEIEDRAR